MKNILEYYYQFSNISLHYRDGVYSFWSENSFYLFKEISRSLEEIRDIYQLLLHHSSFYHKIVLNKDGQLTTFVDQKTYILFKTVVNDQHIIANEQLLSFEFVPEDEKYFSSLRRNDWRELWSKKVDYFEYQIEHIAKKYPILAASLNYYIGLAENAISYMEDIKLHEKKENNDLLSLSHIRLYSTVSIMDYYDPFTIVLDHAARDIAGYLKSVFFENSYDFLAIKELLAKLKFSRYGYRVLFARMLYPSYYFDLYEQIILGKIEEKEIKKIIMKAEEYRKYLKTIYQFIGEIEAIPKVDWI